MAIIGVVARLDDAETHEVQRALSVLDGVTPFAVDVPGKLGVLIEADGADAAHAKLRSEVEAVKGVQGTWPVYADFDSEDAEAENEAPSRPAH